MKHILIADDHEIVRYGVNDIIEKLNIDIACSIYEASTCREMLDILSVQAMDYIILDLQLADGHAFPLIDILVKDYPQTAVIVYTMNAEKIYARRLIRKGVRGYVCKQAGIGELKVALEKFLHGELYLSPALKKELADGDQPNLIDTLSDRELEVVEYLISGMSNKEIAYTMNVDRTTISTFRRRALEKLGAENNTELKEIFNLYQAGS